MEYYMADLSYGIPLLLKNAADFKDFCNGVRAFGVFWDIKGCRKSRYLQPAEKPNKEFPKLLGDYSYSWIANTKFVETQWVYYEGALVYRFGTDEPHGSTIVDYTPLQEWSKENTLTMSILKRYTYAYNGWCADFIRNETREEWARLAQKLPSLFKEFINR